jgi:hypothetical protein
MPGQAMAWSALNVTAGLPPLIASFSILTPYLLVKILEPHLGKINKDLVRMGRIDELDE